MFELRLNNKTILLDWGTLAMRLFTTKNNTDISGYFELMSNAGLNISTLISLVQCGYEAACIKNKEAIEYNENDVCEWLDEIGGVFQTKGQLVDFVKFIVDKTILQVNNEVKEDEKKSLIKLNWDDILVKAAECGIRPNDFWNMTWKDFSIISKGKERNELNEWARTRNLAYIIYLSSTTEKSPKSLKSFWHIPLLDDVEIEEEKVMLTDEQLARTLKMYGVN